jgi:uncharacterized protein YqgC (DUF456 family)
MFFALPGILIGPFAGAVIGEFRCAEASRERAAWGVATWLGMLLGGAAKLALVLSMIALFALSRFL